MEGVRLALSCWRGAPSVCCWCSRVYSWKISSVNEDATTSRIVATVKYGLQPSS